MPTAAIIGGGVIGSAWASRFLLNGWDVRFHDPAPNSEAVLNQVLDKARRWVPEVYDYLPAEGALNLCASIADAACRRRPCQARNVSGWPSSAAL